jgi:hypothetical protein
MKARMTMAKQIKASNGYGDMQGTISVDGWSGLSTMRAGGVIGPEYWPVGLTIQGEARGENETVEPTVYVLAVDRSILDGRAGDGVQKYAREHGELPVFRFRSQLNAHDLFKLLKRLCIELQDKSTEGVPLIQVGGDILY